MGLKAEEVLAIANQYTDEAIGGGGGSEQYSTAETAIGTWIDGRTVYQKVFTGTEVHVGGGWTTFPWADVSDDNIDLLISVSGMGQDSNRSGFPILYESKCWAINDQGLIASAPQNNSYYIDTLIVKYIKSA